MESEVPGRVPRILPFVGHRDYVIVDHVIPLQVSHQLRIHVLFAAVTMLFEPDIEFEEVVLLGPHHAR